MRENCMSGLMREGRVKPVLYSTSNIPPDGYCQRRPREKFGTVRLGVGKSAEKLRIVDHHEMPTQPHSTHITSLQTPFDAHHDPR